MDKWRGDVNQKWNAHHERMRKWSHHFLGKTPWIHYDSPWFLGVFRRSQDTRVWESLFGTCLRKTGPTGCRLNWRALSVNTLFTWKSLGVVAVIPPKFGMNVSYILVSTPLKNISQLVLWFPMYGKMFQATNQYRFKTIPNATLKSLHPNAIDRKLARNGMHRPSPNWRCSFLNRGPLMV